MVDLVSVEMTTHLFLSPLCSSRDGIMVFVFIHHAEDTHRRLISATKCLQQLVMLRTDLLSHLARSFDQFVLHQSRILIVRLQVGLAVGRQAQQARLHRLLLPRRAEVTQDLPIVGWSPGLSVACGATGFLQAAVSVQVQSAGVGHFHFDTKVILLKSTGD